VTSSSAKIKNEWSITSTLLYALNVCSRTTVPFFVPEVASSSYPRESYFMGIFLRNKEAMTPPPKCRPAASSAYNDATCVMHCSGGRWCHVQAVLVFWYRGGCNLPTYHVTLPHYMCHFWQHEVVLTVQPPASNGQRSGRASHWEFPDFVMQFLYTVRVWIAVRHFAASGLRGMCSWLIQHLNKKNLPSFINVENGWWAHNTP